MAVYFIGYLGDKHRERPFRLVKADACHASQDVKKKASEDELFPKTDDGK